MTSFNLKLIINCLKYEHNQNRTIFQYLYDESFKKDERESLFKYYFWILPILLFYSIDESENLADKTQYDFLISNKIDTPIFYDKICKLNNNMHYVPRININNYIWRLMICRSFSVYTSQINKEQDMHNLRAELLEKLK